jgi:hypothetical protein
VFNIGGGAHELKKIFRDIFSIIPSVTYQINNILSTFSYAIYNLVLDKTICSITLKKLLYCQLLTIFSKVTMYFVQPPQILGGRVPPPFPQDRRPCYIEIEEVSLASIKISRPLSAKIL